jgi:hypothetical protein
MLHFTFLFSTLSYYRLVKRALLGSNPARDNQTRAGKITRSLWPADRPGALFCFIPNRIFFALSCLKKPTPQSPSTPPFLQVSYPQIPPKTLKKGGHLQLDLPAPQVVNETTPTGLPLVECIAPGDWDTPVANHHYSLGQIAGALSLTLDCRGSLRGTALATGLINRLLGGEQEVPSPTSVRSWLLRIGLYQLQRPLEKAGDWVWIVDHTVPFPISSSPVPLSATPRSFCCLFQFFIRRYQTKFALPRRQPRS